MKVGVIPATGGAFPVDGARVIEIARAAETSGFDSIWVGEHVVMSPREAYPGASANRVGPSPTGVLPDPLDWLAFAAAATDTLLVGTCILIVPLHNPLVLAKRLATIDQLSGGRVRLGTGVGWSLEEYEAVGVDFHTRGRRCDEAIETLRDLWSNELSAHDGEFFSFPPVHSNPKPVDGAVPVWVGGDSEAAARRAGRLGDGFMPFGRDPVRLRELVTIARHSAEDAGRDPERLELTCLGSRHPHILEQNAETGFGRMLLFLNDPSDAGVRRLAEQAEESTAGL